MDKLAIAALAMGLVTTGIGATVWIAEWWTLRNELRRVIWGNLNDAYECGQFEHDGACYGMTADDLAFDLTCYASDVEDAPLRKVAPHVRAWMKQKGLS